MIVVSLVGIKGGTGKSTLTIALSVHLASEGVRCAAIDLDPQGTLTNWRSRREAALPEVFAATAETLDELLDQLRSENVHFVFIDTPGNLGAVSEAAVRASLLVLVPTRPAIVEAETLSLTRDFVRDLGNPRLLAILNGIHPSAKLETKKRVRDNLEKLYQVECLTITVTALAVYDDAFRRGLGPQEIEPHGRAAHEIEHLYYAIAEQACLAEWLQENPDADLPSVDEAT